MHIVTLDGCGARYLVQIRRCSELIEVWVVGWTQKLHKQIQSENGWERTTCHHPPPFNIALSFQSENARKNSFP